MVANVTDGSSHIVTMPLTERESAAALKFGPMIFGKPQRGPHKNITDIFEFHDRMLEVHSDFPRENLLNQLRDHQHFKEFENLSTAELRIRVAREITKSVDFQSKSALNDCIASEEAGRDAGAGV